MRVSENRGIIFWLVFRQKPVSQQETKALYFLGLRPLGGYASLKLCHVMSCFLYEKRILLDMAG